MEGRVRRSVGTDPVPRQPPVLTAEPEPVGTQLSAVIVNYRSASHVVSCAASLRADGVGEIVVVDNNSDDGCAAVLASADPDARFVAMDRNRGYGAAANRGVRETTGSAVLVCNPDLVVHPGAVAAL